MDQCLSCGKWFVNLNNHKKCKGKDKLVDTKMASIQEDEKDQCPDCGKWFVNLNNHKKCKGKDKLVDTKMASIQEDEKDQCPDCGKWFVNLNNHKKCKGKDKLVDTKMASIQEDEKDLCPDCGKWFVNLNNHKKCKGKDKLVDTKMASIQEDEKDQCPDCGKWFVNLNSHKKCKGKDKLVDTKMASIQEDEKDQCPDCGKWFVNLNSHKKCKGKDKLVDTKMASIQEDEKDQCPDCGKWFVNLNNHKKCKGKDKLVDTKMASIQEDEKDQCPDCGKWFVNLNSHKKCKGKDKLVDTKMASIQEDEKDQCPDCGKWFVNLNNHKKCKGKDKLVDTKMASIQEDEKDQCPDCGKWFVNLNNHKKCKGKDKLVDTKMASIQEDEKDQCPDCGKWFVNLNNHKKCNGKDKLVDTKMASIQEDEKDQCPDCGKWFVNLNNHKKCKGKDKLVDTKMASIQEDEKDQCPDCGKWFVNINNHKNCDGKEKMACIKLDSVEPRKAGIFSGKDFNEMHKIVDDAFSQGIVEKSSDPRADILKFFGNQVMLKKQKMSQASAFFSPIVSTVVKHLNEETPWKWHQLKSGSYYDGTKVSRPDEMDCMFVAEISYLEVVTAGAPPGFCYVRQKRPQADVAQFCQGDYISSTNFRKHVFGCLQTIAETNRRITRDTTLSEGSPSFGVNYNTGLKNEDGSQFIISMDLVPALYLPGWPDIAKDFSKEKEERLKNISRNGFHVVAKTYNGDSRKDRDILWRLSFSASEKVLTKFADSVDNGICNGEEELGSAGRTCRKKVLRILKRILEIVKSSDKDLRVLESGLDSRGRAVFTALRAAATHVRSLGFRVDQHRFTTFQLRTLMWNEFYRTTVGDHVWRTEQLIGRLSGVMIKLKKMLTGEIHVEHFFIRGLDIMAEVPIEERKYLYIMVCVAERFL